MRCRLLHDSTGDPRPDDPEGKLPAGTIVEHPDAWKLVLMGSAEPADEECQEKVSRQATPDQLRRAQRIYIRGMRGIHPEDFAAYNRGEMVGYNSDGSWKKPGGGLLARVGAALGFTATTNH
jgi:hypothetical protein